MNKTKNVVFALILTSAILLSAISVSSVTAQTTNNTYIYATIGGSISVNGNTLTAGAEFASNTNENAVFTAVPELGFTFLAWEYATAAGACTVKDNPTSINITAEGALQAMFLPTNASGTSTQTGSATLVLMNSIGGTTNPSSTPPDGTYTNYTIGEVATLTATPASGFKFLYWVVATSAASYFDTATINFNVTEDICALQAFFIPTDSDVTLPGQPTPTPIPEISSVAIAVALLAGAVGTFTYRKKAKK